MYYYVSAFFVYGIVLFFLVRAPTRFHFAIFCLGLLPLFLLVACRGNVGTDTVSYLQIISQVQDGVPPDMEFGFLFLIKTFLFFDVSPRMILAAIASITTALLMYAASFSGRSLLVVAFCIVPIFYLDMTMNGLRYGLAFSCAMCAAALFYQEKLVPCFLFAVCSVLFHLSGLFVFALMAIFSGDRQEFKKWMVVSITSFALAFAFNGTYAIFMHTAHSTQHTAGILQYLMMKFESYKNFPSPNWYSGLAPLLLSVMILALIKKTGAIGDSVAIRRFYGLLIGAALMFLFAKLSYAGLRLQFAFLFFMLMFLQFKPAFSCVACKTQHAITMKTFFVIAIVGIAIFFKNALTTEGQGPSPWLPYSHVLDEVDLIKAG